MIDVELTAPQWDFVNSDAAFPAMVAGYASGKSHAAIIRALYKKMEYPKGTVAYYLPTYDLVARMAIPRFTEMLSNWGLTYKVNKNDALIEIDNYGTVIFRTMDRPERIVAYESSDAICDELDTLPIDKARDVWNKVIARNRQNKPNGGINSVGVATTPEGFRFVYETWAKEPKQGYEIIKASTYSNAHNLPDGYIDNLKATYSSSLLLAYLDGEFVNLNASSVYPDYDRALNATNEIETHDEPLHIGMDFNVGKMSAAIAVLRNDCPIFVSERSGIIDTPAMASILKRDYPNRRIFVYPDASGNSRKSNNASESDISILKQAGFTVLVNNRNPAVKDRVLSMNKVIRDRRMKVNTDKCPLLVESLEKQAYDKNGEPDKTAGHDHMNDAAGYLVAYRYPIVKEEVNKIKLKGL